MIVTDKFVLLNWPKTGSTFVRTALREIIRPREVAIKPAFLARQINNALNPSFKEFLKPSQRHGWRGYLLLNQHSPWSRLPERYRHLPVLLVVRDPLDRNISEYFFRWWAKYPILPRSIILEWFPNFPHLSFEQFLEYKMLEIPVRLASNSLKVVLGPQTVEFLMMLARSLPELVRDLSEDSFRSGRYRVHLPPELHLLRTEHLNHDLSGCLKDFGFSAWDIEHVQGMKPIQPKEGTMRNSKNTVVSMYSEELFRRISEREKWLYHMYNDLGARYSDCPVSKRNEMWG